MNCKELKKILPDYTNKKLSKSQIDEFLNHLNSCSECTKIYKRYNNTLGLLKPKAEIDEQAFYFTRLKQKMENENPIKESLFIKLLSKKIIQPAIYLTSLFIAVYIGILIGSGSATPTQFSEYSNDTDYIQTFSEYQYFNDYDIEPIENLFLADNNISE